MTAKTGAKAFLAGVLLGVAFVAWWPAGVALTVLLWVWCVCAIAGRSDERGEADSDAE